MRVKHVLSMFAATAIIAATPGTAFAQPATIENPAPAPPVSGESTTSPGAAPMSFPGVGVPSDPSNDPDYPSESFSNSGYKGSETHWKDLELKIGSYVMNGPYPKLADQMTFKVSVTMTSKSPLIQWSCLYSPRGLGGVDYLDMGTHLQAFLIVDGQEAWSGNTNEFSCNNSGQAVPLSTNPHNWANRDIEVGVRAWTNNLDGDWQTVGAKTGKATCDPLEPGGDPNVGTLCRLP